MSKVLSYFYFLERTDHPAIARHKSPNVDGDSPVNAVLNMVFAEELAAVREDIEDFRKNSHPHSVAESGINLWEQRYFGFTKAAGIGLEVRREQLLVRYNGRPSLSLPYVIELSKAFTGLEPIQIRNDYFEGWILGEAALGVNTVLGGGDNVASRHTYIVFFDEPIPNDLLNKLDEELTKIEKVGSKHYLVSPLAYWKLGESILGTDTILG